MFYLPDVRLVHYVNERGSKVEAHERLRPSRFGRALVRRAGRLLSDDARARAEVRFGIDLELHFSATQKARMEHHYAYWADKWG